MKRYTTTTLLEVQSSYDESEASVETTLLDLTAPLSSSCEMGKQEEVVIITGSIQIFP